MIVRTVQHEVHLITQPDHAALSRRIMEHWRPLHDHPLANSILLAIGEHDNGWRELDEVPFLDANGLILDFVQAPAKPKQDVWPRGVERLTHDPFAAALVAHHAVTVYDRFRTDAEWLSFFPMMERMRDEHRAQTHTTHDELVAAYRFVRLGDLLSLTFCTGWRDVQSYQSWTVHLEDEHVVVVSPSELDQAELPIEIHARQVPPAHPSAEALREAMALAPVVTISGLVRG
jgi:uncharacterized protein DUF3891